MTTISISSRHALRWASGLALALAATLAQAHGDVTPQAVDTKELPSLGEAWRAENPFRANDKAIKIGTSAYNQNCARCHGLEAISGGIAPDLRKLDNDCVSLKDAAKKAACVKEIDEYYLASVRRGKTRNGAVYMPPFEGILNQEAVWSIKAYLETRREKPL
jgi:cytochrome c-550 PedF